MEYMRTPGEQYRWQTIEGRAVVVTGGTTGIGRATARLLAANGVHLLIFGRHKQELEEALDELQRLNATVFGITADVSRPDDVRRVFDEADRRLGGIDVLVNNAALGSREFVDETLDNIAYVLMTNVLGYIACAHEAVKRMQGRGGHIINIGSMSADLREGDAGVYVASKAAVQAFSESLRKTVNEQGIKVSLIEPGRVATDMVDESQEEKERKVEHLEMLEPEDIARCTYFCLAQAERCDLVSLQVRPHRQII